MKPAAPERAGACRPAGALRDVPYFRIDFGRCVIRRGTAKREAIAAPRPAPPDARVRERIAP